jgi:hypothetical protein
MPDAALPRLDPDRILADARALAFPRYPGTEGGRRAIEGVAGRLRAAGLAVAVEEFSYDLRPAWRALRGMLGGCALAVAAAGLVAPRSQAAAAALLVAAILPAGAFLAWAPWLERIYRQPGPTVTANVEGRRPAAGRRRLTLVVLAHHDSKSQNLSLLARAGLTLAALAGAGTLAALLAAPGAPAAGPAAAAGLATAAALGVLATLRSGDESPGGVDNAGSLGILCELARTLPAHLPPDVELIVLSPGAEEDHMVGAMRWLDRHAEELAAAPVAALNFDGAGNPGRLVLLEWYGFGRAFAPALAATARRQAARLGLPLRRVLLPPGHGVDAIPFAHRGLPCLTLTSGRLGRATLAVHTAADSADLLDRDTLLAAARLAAATALEVSA